MSPQTSSMAGVGVASRLVGRARLGFVSFGVIAIGATAGAACSSSSNSGGSPAPTTVPAMSSSASAPTSPAISCGAIESAVADLKAKVDGWKAGQVSRDEVEAAARRVVDTVSSQASAAGRAARAALTALASALSNLIDIVTKSGVTDTEIEQAAAAVASAASALAITCPS